MVIPLGPVKEKSLDLSWSLVRIFDDSRVDEKDDRILGFLFHAECVEVSVSAATPI